jgi:anti-anti-sigma factor
MAGKLLTYPSASSRAATIQGDWESLAPALEAVVRVCPGAAPVVSIRGELDLAGADDLEYVVAEVILRHGPDLIIDASGLFFCDARGLGALVRCANEVGRAGGRFTLANPSDRLRRLVRIVHLEGLL